MTGALSPSMSVAATAVAVQAMAAAGQAAGLPDDAASQATGLDPIDTVPGTQGLWAIRPGPFFVPAAPRSETELRGKALILVGGEKLGRRFLFEEPARAALELGMSLFLVDEPNTRPEGLSPDRFIGAPIFDHSSEAMTLTVNRVIDTIVASGLGVAGVVSFFSPFSSLAAAIRTGLRTRGHVIPGDPFDSVMAADTKQIARQYLVTYAPDIAVPFEAFPSAATDLAQAQAEARAAFLRITGGDPAKRVVLKPIKGAAKIGVLTNISNPAEAAAGVAAIDAKIRGIMHTSIGQQLHVDDYAGIMMELQLGGADPTPEVDVEVVLGASGGFAFVIGNPRATPPHMQERGFTLPSPLPPDIQRDFVSGALQGLQALGLRWGNFHVEMIWTPNGPRIVEFNPRMGGGPIFLLTQRLWGGWNLIEQGIRGFLGLDVMPPIEQTHPIVISRYVLPKDTGTVWDVGGVQAAAGATGILKVHIAKKPGDLITIPVDGHGDDKFGYVTGTGGDYFSALNLVLHAMSLMQFDVQLPNGRIVRQGGDHGNTGPTYEVLQ